MSSRRARNSSTIAVHSSFGPVIASTAPTWANVGTQLIVLMIKLAEIDTIDGGTIAKPSRQPVIANVLREPVEDDGPLGHPGRVAIEMCSSPSYMIRP